jgi:hypothetical protein
MSNVKRRGAPLNGARAMSLRSPRARPGAPPARRLCAGWSLSRAPFVPQMAVLGSNRSVYGNQSCPNGPLAASTLPDNEGLTPERRCQYHKINDLSR